jgi:hypothetical protein
MCLLQGCWNYPIKLGEKCLAYALENVDDWIDLKNCDYEKKCSFRVSIIWNYTFICPAFENLGRNARTKNTKIGLVDERSFWHVFTFWFVFISGKARVGATQ